ncbi:2-C-methyl-D-erythritol 2,4-cyclodiphosphate synthase [candidate division WOR_3 bacterium SM23_60]|uniref:2-C-methyl-D-erythritol 2,4-cyclodiphosphate synthase n=1 Tax=candidate division WOR_3 bacterium SM23_60 TaxID=1703780 RepID=A0A0S8G3E2_UNCW3|nr:MAG: 2-C-methyl-D-erythritol 2,4-cyclodiphosphate synthase [candidate division WOR_3 bacterium SM23_60]
MVGIGYDIHRLVEKRPLYLGGVRINFDKGLLGHSDGDVLIHAIGDALLGAAHLGDIGQHFPPDDNRYKDISSNDILKNIAGMIENKQMIVSHIDAIIICEAPKILPHVAPMKKNIASILKMADTSISIKGKTNEGIGAIGEGKAIAAWAVCEVEKGNASS